MKRFIKEIKKGYDYIGISFITPNFIKAKKMCELIREHSPKTKIILGGHGTRIPELESLLDCDHIIRGEGISVLRKLFGDKVDDPIKHPILPGSEGRWARGASFMETGMLLPGLGCSTACRFCCTSHQFEKKYVPFFKTGEEVFAIMQGIEKKLGYKEFFVLDVNFLKHKKRALELLDLMKTHNKPYTFAMLSSARIIIELGVKFIYEMGIRFLWIGVEPKKGNYEKNKGIDMKRLFTDLRNHGVATLASTILFEEQHDKKTLWEDVDYILGLRPDFVQLMQLLPLPQTELYLDYKKRGELLEDMPYEEWHGQRQLVFKHPNFTVEEPEVILREAFRKDYHELGPSVLRMADTYMHGYLRTQKYQDEDDPWLKKRNKQLRTNCETFYPLLYAMKLFMPNAKTKQFAKQVIKVYEEVLGPREVRQKLLTQAGYIWATMEYLKLKTLGDVRQPKTIYTPPGSVDSVCL